MKALTIGIICFTLTNFVSCDYNLLTSAVIKERAAILDTHNDWYNELDNAHFKVYEKLKQTIVQAFKSTVTFCNDVMIAYGNLRGSLQTIDASGQAVDQIPQNLASLMSSVNETCNDFVTFGIGRKTSFLVGTLGRRSIPAISLRNAIQPHLLSIINYVSLLNPTPKSDSCAINILTKFNTFYKPLVDDNVDRAENVIAQFPQLGENITASIALNKPIFTTLINKINACFKIKSDASRLTCVQQLDSYYTGNSSAKIFALNNAFQAPQTEYTTSYQRLFTNFYAIYPVPFAFRPIKLPEFLQKVATALELIC